MKAGNSPVLTVYVRAYLCKIAGSWRMTGGSLLEVGKCEKEVHHSQTVKLLKNCLELFESFQQDIVGYYFFSFKMSL